MAISANEVVTTITEVRQLTTSGGKNYWLLKDVNRKVFKTWSGSVAKTAMDHPNQPVRIIFHEDHWQGRSGPMTDLLIDELDPTPQPPAPAEPMGPMATGAFAGNTTVSGNLQLADDDPPMKRKDWEDKEDRDAVRRLYISHLANIVSLSSSDPNVGYDDMVAEARQKASEDLHWVRNYATGDVPF